MKAEIMLLMPLPHDVEGEFPARNPGGWKIAEIYLSDFLGLDMDDPNSFGVFCERYGLNAFLDMPLRDNPSLDVGSYIELQEQDEYMMSNRIVMEICKDEVQEAQQSVKGAMKSGRPESLNNMLESHARVMIDFKWEGDRRQWWQRAVGRDAIGAACLAAGVLLERGKAYRQRGLVCDKCGCPLPKVAKISTCEACRDQAMRDAPFFKAKWAAYQRAARTGVTKPEHERYEEFRADWEAVNDTKSLERFKEKWGPTRGQGRPSRKEHEVAD